MGILDKLKNKMKEATNSPTNKAIEETLPSDEQLKERKASRKEAAGKATEWLTEKGYPGVGAVTGAAMDISADMIPETREEYKEEMMGSLTPMGTTRISKLSNKMPIPQEAYRTRWNRLSGAERDQWGNKFEDFLKSEVKQDQIIKAEADNAAEALRTTVRSNPKEATEPLVYSGTQAKERRALLDPSRKIDTTQQVVDLEKSKIPEDVSKIIQKEPTVMEPKFRTHEGPSVQDLKRLREEEAYAKALAARKRK